MRKAILGALVCALSSMAVASVTVSSPTNGSTISGAVHVESKTSSSSTIIATKVYVDMISAYTVSSATVNTDLSLATGKHVLEVQSWEANGTVLKSAPVAITVSSPSGVPAGAKVYSNIHQMTGWESCDACAGAGGAGPTATISMKQFLASPSLTGKSAEFYLKGSKPYSNALWWRQLGPNPSVSNFQYDLYFYLKNPSAAQALEFDVNQALNGYKYIFGTECDIKSNHVWKIYDPAGHQWMQTGVACTAPTAYAWNHLTWEFQRVNGELKFVSITLNGKKSYINKTYRPEGSSSKELDVALQIDGDSYNTAYSEWADKVSLTAW